MSDPKTKIARGLDNRARESKPDSIPLENLSGAPSSVSDLEAIASRVLDIRTKLVDSVANNTKHIRAHREKTKAEVEEQRRIRDGNHITFRWDTNHSRQMVDQEVNRYSREISKTTEKDLSLIHI